jgi:hypothetical protein
VRQAGYLPPTRHARFPNQVYVGMDPSSTGLSTLAVCNPYGSTHVVIDLFALITDSTDLTSTSALAEAVTRSQSPTSPSPHDDSLGAGSRHKSRPPRWTK